MRAMIVRQPGGLDRLQLVDVPEPGQPGPGELLVRIHASSLNFHDYHVVSGAGVTEDRRIPMSDGAGEVMAVGESVTEFGPGDHVVSTFFPTWADGPGVLGLKTVPGDGIDGYAREWVVAPATAFTRAPVGYSHSEAATLTCAGVTAWRALVAHGPVRAGETVLVMGTGGVSIFALQLAKAMGARVIATSSSDEKLDRLLSLGADAVINYRKVEAWGKKAYDLSEGGVDHVVEIGGPATLPESIAAARLGGHIALIGVLTGWSGPVPTAALMSKQIRLQGVMVGSRRDQLDLVQAVEITKIRPIIAEHFPLEGLADAFRYQETGRHFGKICIDI